MLRCIGCQGQKFTLGMGHIREKCKSCNGIGFIKKVDPITITVFDTPPGEDVFKKVLPIVKSKRDKKGNSED